MNDKVAVVVGGGSGMGAAVARRLAGDGYRIAVLSSSGKGEKLARDLGGIGMAGSNRSSDDLQALMDEVLQRWGRIDALVNSAGHGPKSPVLDLSDAQWFEGMEVYLLNVIRAARLVAPVMVRQGAVRWSTSPRPGRWSPARCSPPRRCFARVWLPSPSCLLTSMRPVRCA